MHEGAVDYLLGWRAGRSCGPYALNVRPTDSCNLLCISCDKGRDRKGRSIASSCELSDKQLLRLVRDAAGIGARHLIIDGGGEPLLRRKATMGMMAEAKNKGMTGFLVTNGTLFEREDLGMMVDRGWDHVHFSIDGPDAETHDFLRGMPGCFDRAMRNIRELVSYKEEQGKEKPQIWLATVLSNANYSKIGAIIRLAHSLSLYGVYLQPLYTQTRSAYNLLLSASQKVEFQAALPGLRALSDDLGIETNLHHLMDRGLVDESNRLGAKVLAEARHGSPVEGEHFLAAPCYAPWITLGVRPGGITAPCPSASPEICGHLSLHRQSMEEIWFGQFFTAFRRRLLEHELYPFCRTCCGGMMMETRDYRERLKRSLEGGTGGAEHR